MLKNLVLGIALITSVASAGIVASIALAQVQEKQNTAKSLFTRQPCDNLPEMLKAVAQYKEEALFIGEGLTFQAPTGNPLRGGMMFFVNQDTGTWTMLQLYGDGVACMVMNGREFTPYTGPKMNVMKPEL